MQKWDAFSLFVFLFLFVPIACSDGQHGDTAGIFWNLVLILSPVYMFGKLIELWSR